VKLVFMLDLRTFAVLCSLGLGPTVKIYAIEHGVHGDVKSFLIMS